MSIALAIASTILLAPWLAGREVEVVALFNLDSPAGGPFPSDGFTARDDTQNTGLRVSLPEPDPAYVSDSEDVDVINELDGFNLQPRLSIPFSGAINPYTVTSETVFLVRLGSTLPDDDRTSWGTLVGIDQVVWDPSTETLHVESDQLLDQHTRYALVVTKRVRGEDGKNIKAAKEFLRFVDDDVTESTGDSNRDAYRAVLRGALTQLDTYGIVPKGQVVAASVFTTQSATSLLEKIRNQTHAATPDPANFLLGFDGERTVFRLTEVTGATGINLGATSPLRTVFPGAVGSVAFGRYRSWDYEKHPGEYIPPVATRTGVPVVQGTNDIYFNLFLPSGPPPAVGWPVVIFGHGAGNNKNVLPLSVASSMAHHGIATIAINAVGHGFSPTNILTVSRTVGGPVNLPAGGRGIDQDGNGVIGPSEGLATRRPRAAVVFSDGIRQTVADLMQLVRVIQVGMDVDGDSQSDLDSSRIYYLGNSLGGGYGTVFLGVEPDVKAGVLTVPLDPIPGVRLGVQRDAAGMIFSTRLPPLLNFPGVKIIDGLTVDPAPPFFFFDENIPLRDEIRLTVGLEDSTTRDIVSPVTNIVAGAMEIQAVGEHLEWVSQVGSPLAYAPHLRKAPLVGMSAKSVIFQFAKGDMAASNPSTTAILRAGDLADRTLYYLYDLARAEGVPPIPQYPHTFAVSVTSSNPTVRAISLGAQDQAGGFFASNGTTIIHPEPLRFFEWPIDSPPEGLNYIIP
jgi:hypothetical protein